jgi:hypothetical protein
MNLVCAQTRIKWVQLECLPDATDRNPLFTRQLLKIAPELRLGGVAKKLSNWRALKMFVTHLDAPAIFRFLKTSPDILRHFWVRETPQLPFQRPHGGWRKRPQCSSNDARAICFRQCLQFVFQGINRHTDSMADLRKRRNTQTDLDNDHDLLAVPSIVRRDACIFCRGSRREHGLQNVGVPLAGSAVVNPHVPVVIPDGMAETTRRGLR